MKEKSKTKRLTQNTIFLYLRMFVMMSVSLYTSRIVLNTLGINDFGIYNVIGGFVTMFTLLSGALTNSITRFLTYEIGKPSNQTKLVFSSSLTVMIILSIIILILGEIAGYLFVNFKMNVPIERISAANWTLQCSLITFIINLLNVPYNSMIIANEKMLAFSLISILETFLKLVIVYLLALSTYDKLILYSILLMSVSIFIRVLYLIYAKKQFKDCRYVYTLDKKLLKEISSFAGWNTLGSGAAIINIHGINMLMNIFYGVSVNAARGVATQVNNAVQQFAYNFMIALNPQITKSYAQEDYKYMHNLIFKGSKFSYFLMLALIIPICIETDYILKLWLNIVPLHTKEFVRLTLITSTITILTSTSITGLHATGKIKRYMIIVGLTECMNFPITYIFFKLGYPPTIAYQIYLLISIILIILRIFLIKDLLFFKFKDFLKQVIYKCLYVSIISPILPLYLCSLQPPSIIRFIETCIISTLTIVISIYLVGIDKHERNFIKNYIKKHFKTNNK